MTAVATTQTILPPFDYSALRPEQAALARDAVPYIEARQRGMASAAIEIGAKCNEVKAALEHGQFTAWLSASFSMTPRTAQNYMQAATALGSKSETVSYLPVTTVYELARTPDPIREKVLEEIETAPTPVPAKEVSNLIYQAKEDARRAEQEARTPSSVRARRARSQKAQEAKDRAHWRARGQQEARDERALVKLTEILRSALDEAKQAEVADLMLMTPASIHTLSRRITGDVYGHVADEHGNGRRARTRDEWDQFLADIANGENGYRHPLRDRP